MRILGIDPGYATTGFGVLQTERGQLHLLNYGTITTPAGLTLSRRLVMLYDDMMELLKTVGLEDRAKAYPASRGGCRQIFHPDIAFLPNLQRYAPIRLILLVRQKPVHFKWHLIRVIKPQIYSGRHSSQKIFVYFLNVHRVSRLRVS